MSWEDMNTRRSELLHDGSGQYISNSFFGYLAASVPPVKVTELPAHIPSSTSKRYEFFLPNGVSYFCESFATENIPPTWIHMNSKTWKNITKFGSEFECNLTPGSIMIIGNSHRQKGNAVTWLY